MPKCTAELAALVNQDFQLSGFEWGTRYLHQWVKSSASEFGDCCSFNLLATPGAGASLSPGVGSTQKAGTRAEQCWWAWKSCMSSQVQNAERLKALGEMCRSGDATANRRYSKCSWVSRQWGKKVPLARSPGSRAVIPKLRSKKWCQQGTTGPALLALAPRLGCPANS